MWMPHQVQAFCISLFSAVDKLLVSALTIAHCRKRLLSLPVAAVSGYKHNYAGGTLTPHAFSKHPHTLSKHHRRSPMVCALLSYRPLTRLIIPVMCSLLRVGFSSNQGAVGCSESVLALLGLRAYHGWQAGIIEHGFLNRVRLLITFLPNNFGAS